MNGTCVFTILCMGHALVRARRYVFPCTRRLRSLKHNSPRIPYYGRHAFTPSLTTKSSEECEFYLTLAYLTLLFHHDYCSCDDTRVLRVKTSNRRPWVFTHTLIWCLLFSSPLLVLVFMLCYFKSLLECLCQSLICTIQSTHIIGP